MNISYRIIDQEHSEDIRLKNDPFPLYGRMIPSLQAGKWSHEVHLFSEEQRREMCFPDENYDYASMSKEYTFIGAYNGEKCVGLSIMQDKWFKYMYIEDLKVSQDYRGKGIGRGLIEKSMEVAREKKYNGIYLVGQDDNLAACQFYLQVGFEIGGFDDHVYRGTAQEGKGDIYFYLDSQRDG